MLRPSRAASAFVLTSFLALPGLACQRKEAAPLGASVAASARVSANPAPPPPVVAAPSASAAPPRPKPQPAETFLMAWSSALNRHAIAELASFYAPQVIFYGRRKTLDEVVAAKRQALEKAPQFRQSVTDVHVQQGPNGFVLRFKKLSGSDVLKTVAARLVVEASPGKLAIVEESDAATDERTADAAPATCTEAVDQIVGRHPVIEADVTRVAREYPEARPGGFYYDEVAKPDRVSLSQGYFHNDRYEPRWWIDAADGVLTIRDALTTELLVVTAKQRATVAKLCTGKADAEAAAPGN